MEIQAHSSYSDLNYDINFWRTKSGLEVDFILGGGEVAVEVKGAARLDRRDLHATSRFLQDHRPRQAIIVCNEPEPRVADGIQILPWREFTTRLWSGDILS